jgi:cytochrome oxidase Cu insertion factor (SCO1/SenC/PrrC family)
LSEAESPGSPFSRQTVRLFAGAVAVLLVLGAVVGALTRGGGSPSKAAGGTTSLPGAADTTLPLGSALPATLAALMGLTSLHSRLAPGLELVDQLGRRVTLTGLQGKVVLLTFLDAGCTGICPIESAELRAAEQDLAGESSQVVVLVVDIDAAHKSVADMGGLARLTGLGTLATFHALIGPLASLRRVWAAYGVQVQVDEVHGTVLYGPLMVFIDPSGRERYLATPSGFELASGKYVLPKQQVAAFGRGIAHFATVLLPSSP